MKAYRKIFIVMCVTAMLATCFLLQAGESKDTWSIGGQNVKRTDGPPVKVPNPVSPDAVVQISGATGSIIANVFPSDASGNVSNSAIPKVIMATGTDTFKLNQTMDNSKLEPGTYLINAVANDKTNRAVFTVK